MVEKISPRRWLTNVVALLVLCGHVSCGKKGCGDPGTSPHGERLGECCSSGSSLYFRCRDNYELVGDVEMTCLRTGLWSAKRPLCKPLYSEYCEFPDPTPHTRLRGTKKGDYFVPGEKAQVWCEPGYRCEGNDNVECGEGGVWTKEFGVCKEVFCERPPPVENGKIPEVMDSNRTSFSYGSDIHYVCDKGYRIDGTGDSWRTCIGAGVWSGRDPSCKAIRCQDPGTPENGMRVSSLYPVGSRIRFSCNAEYELKGAEEILCQANGEWAGELTECHLPEYSQCGLRKEKVGAASGRIVGGQPVTEPWPWMAALYMKESKDKTEELKCGGSVVHQRFILTAGHCMYSSRDRRREPSDITVKLGLVNVTDWEHVQQLEVRKIYIHKNYTNRIFDYDAALLELKEPIQYNSRVLPICLPPTAIPADSPFYIPQAKVWIAGWGSVKKRTMLEVKPARTSHVLKEIQLYIQPRETCRESLLEEDKHFTDRMFCAGTGEASNDTCMGDSGSPVMQQHLNAAGDPSWTQVGIVSWGIGCGLTGHYSFFSHLHKLMPWLEETVRKAEQWNE